MAWFCSKCLKGCPVHSSRHGSNAYQGWCYEWDQFRAMKIWPGGTWGERGVLMVPNICGSCGCYGHKHAHCCCCDSISSAPLVRWWEQPQNRLVTHDRELHILFRVEHMEDVIDQCNIGFSQLSDDKIRKGFCWRWSACPSEAVQWGIFPEPGTPRPFSQQRG